VDVGGGAGGAIRLVANSLDIAGRLSARGQGNSPTFDGVIRLEAPAGAIRFVENNGTTPAPVLTTINPQLILTDAPSLRIVSVGGFVVPPYSGRRFDTVDLLLPTQLPDPIDVVVAGTNIPVGSSVQLAFGTGNTGTVTSAALSGTLQASTATLHIAGLDRRAM